MFVDENKWSAGRSQRWWAKKKRAQAEAVDARARPVPEAPTDGAAKRKAGKRSEEGQLK